jgi:hypothetical protein
MIYGAKYWRSAFTGPTGGLPDPDPNTFLFNASGVPNIIGGNTPTGFWPTGVVDSLGRVQGATFETPETYQGSNSAGLLLALAETAGGNSTVTYKVYAYDGSYCPTAPTTGTWVLMAPQATVTEGTPVSVPGIRGPNIRVDIQIISTANNPAALLGFFWPLP